MNPIPDITAQGSIIDEAYIDFIFADPNDQAHAWAINNQTNKQHGQHHQSKTSNS